MTYYFSTSDGDDTRTAFQAQNSATPWQTLTKLNSFFGSLLPGDQVLFKKGDIFYGSIIPTVSGSSGSPISFGAYGSGSLPVITGLQEVAAWTSLGGNQWESTSAVSTLSTLNMVVAGGFVPAPVGKWPNGTFAYNNIASHTGGDLAAGTPASITSGTSLPFDWTGGEVVIRKRHWIIDRATITSQASNTINFINPSIYGSTDGFGFFIQNHRDACDQVNEWWYDSASKKIGIYNTVTPTGVQVANIDYLVNIGSRSYLNFTEIQFAGSNTATVNVTSGHHCNFAMCEFFFQGINGFFVTPAANNLSVIACSANYTNNNFIEGASGQTWTIVSNTIENTGQIPGSGQSKDGNYIGIHNVGSNSLVQYNNLINTGYNGIEFKGDNVRILNNLVDTFCNVKDDGGGIYSYVGPTTASFVFRTVDHNIILNAIGAPDGTTTSNTDAHGIYMDDNTSQVTISNNTIANCGGAGLFLHANHDIKVLNNTFFNNAITTANVYAQIFEVFPGATLTAPVRNLVVTGNKFVSKEATQRVASYKTNEGNMSQWPLGLTNANYNNNYYARPINEDATTIQVIRSGGTTVTDLPGWVSLSGASLDGASNISPITIASTADFRFEVNPTNSTVVVSLGTDVYVDIAGVAYTGDVNLAAWSSLLLIITDSVPPPTGSNITSITVGFLPCDPMPVEGYDIIYRVVGDPDYIDAGFFTASPAVIPVDYPAGTQFEGLILSSCGDVPWFS